MIGLQLGACLLPSVSSESPLVDRSAPVEEMPEARDSNFEIDAAQHSEPAAPASDPVVSVKHEVGQSMSAAQTKHDAGQAMSAAQAGLPQSAPAPSSNCPPGACANGKCVELTNNYWCECNPGYMLSGRECVFAPPTAKLRANGDGTVSVIGTMTLWQDPVAAMSFGYEAAEQYCANLSLAGFSDWQMPSGLALSRLCPINAANPVLTDSTSAYWIASRHEGWWDIVSCNAEGIEEPVYGGSVARVRCVHAPTE